MYLKCNLFISGSEGFAKKNAIHLSNFSAAHNSPSPYFQTNPNDDDNIDDDDHNNNNNHNNHNKMKKKKKKKNNSNKNNNSSSRNKYGSQ